MNIGHGAKVGGAKASGAKAAVGVRAHSGWAALVVLAGPARSPEFVLKRRITLIDACPRQPYHAAEHLPLPEAEALVGLARRESESLALRALRLVLDELDAYDPAGCAILMSSGRALGPLASTLASHALIHTAEGELYREALRYAAGQCNLAITATREREVYDHAAAALQVSRESLDRRIAEMGKLAGPPWTADQKLAAVAAWLHLATSTSSGLS